MNYTDSAQASPAREHAVTLEGRARLELTGVTAVRGFNEDIVLLTTSAGDLTVRGETLHIGRLDLTLGEVSVTGRVSELMYSEPPAARGFWARLFGG